MPNYAKHEQMAQDIELMEEREKALKMLGWMEVDGVWFSPYGASFGFQEACEFMGFK